MDNQSFAEEFPFLERNSLLNVEDKPSNCILSPNCRPLSGESHGNYGCGCTKQLSDSVGLILQTGETATDQGVVIGTIVKWF